MSEGINDDLVMPCAQCCRKHLSAALACYVDSPHGADSSKAPGGVTPVQQWRVLLARALINLTEADQGYASHRPYAVGLLVLAETEAPSKEAKIVIREFRTAVEAGDNPPPPYGLGLLDWYWAHVREAEREYPDIVGIVNSAVSLLDGEPPASWRKTEVEFRLAQLKWLDENVFGYKPKEKGEE